MVGSGVQMGVGETLGQLVEGEAQETWMTVDLHMKWVAVALGYYSPHSHMLAAQDTEVVVLNNSGPLAVHTCQNVGMLKKDP